MLGKGFLHCFIMLSIILFSSTTLFAEETSIDLNRLKEAYPEMIQATNGNYIIWKDGTRTKLIGNSFFNRLAMVFHGKNDSLNYLSSHDLQCHGVEPFFKKMYGSTEAEVKQKLVVVYWMPKIFGDRYPLKVTTVNGINKKIERISAELEKLPPSDFKYLENPAGSFYWRKVKYEKYLSAHSFGIAMDINSHYGSYWLWDWERIYHKKPMRFTLRNNIPKEIVAIFEKEGFLWGGHWYFYDTMHFEYRPELFIHTANNTLRYDETLDNHCYG